MIVLSLVLSLLFSQNTETATSKNTQGAQVEIVGQQDSNEVEISSIPPLVSDIIEKYRYIPREDQNPFESYVSPNQTSYASKKVQGPLLPLQRYDLGQLKLVGVIWGGKKPMGMIADSKGKIYYVRQKDKIGNSNGYVARIREGEIVVIESIIDEYGNTDYVTKVMQIEKKSSN